MIIWLGFEFTYDMFPFSSRRSSQFLECLLAISGFLYLSYILGKNAAKQCSLPTDTSVRHSSSELQDLQGVNWAYHKNENTQKCLNIERLCRCENTATSEEIKIWKDLRCLELLAKYYKGWLKRYLFTSRLQLDWFNTCRYRSNEDNIFACVELFDFKKRAKLTQVVMSAESVVWALRNSTKVSSLCSKIQIIFHSFRAVEFCRWRNLRPVLPLRQDLHVECRVL